MKIVKLKKDKTEFHAKVTVPLKDIAGFVSKELAKIAKTAKINGFRVGKVPTKILKKKYLTSVNTDITKNKINDAINDCIKKYHLNLAINPDIIDIINEEEKDLEFTLKFELLPEISLPDFKKISIEKPELNIAKEDIEEQIKKLAELSKTYEVESKDKAQKGDQVTLDALGYVDGETFKGGKLDNQKLVLGSNIFILGIENQLIDTKKGDNLIIKVDFPKDCPTKKLAGKPSEFKVQITAVHKGNTPKIDDEFAKRFNCENMNKLKEQIFQDITTRYEEPIHLMMKMKLFDKLENMLKFEVPKSLLEREIAILKKQTEESWENDPSTKRKSNKGKIRYFENLANRRVRIGLMLAEYVKQKNLQIQEEDFHQAIISQAKNYPGQEQQVIEFYQKDRRALELLKGPVLERKSVKEIFNNEIILNKRLYAKDKLEKLLEKEIEN